MAQSSAQRDPSMEEILASIRRIIEEGEEARKPAEARDEFEPTPIGPAANDAMRRPLPPAPELRKEIPAVEPVEVEVFSLPVTEPESSVEAEASSQELSAEELSLSLDDFVIDMDDVDDIEPPHGKVIDAEAATESAKAIQKGVIAADAAPSPRAEAVKPKRIEPEFTQLAEAEPLPQVAQPVEEAASREETPQAAAASAPLPAPETASSSVASISQKAPELGLALAPAPEAAQKASMLSRAVERQVAASFTELGEALAASRQRSLDQIAEEMLRPMLQEWLDNNLPTLVERLVREEIERVARGAA